MSPHHKSWLDAHPGRTAEWLDARMKDGFHIHHLDGNDLNNDHRNLVLVEGWDHIAVLHAEDRKKRMIIRWKEREEKRLHAEYMRVHQKYIRLRRDENYDPKLIYWKPQWAGQMP